MSYFYWYELSKVKGIELKTTKIIKKNYKIHQQIFITFYFFVLSVLQLHHMSIKKHQKKKYKPLSSSLQIANRL